MRNLHHVQYMYMYIECSKLKLSIVLFAKVKASVLVLYQIYPYELSAEWVVL